MRNLEKGVMGVAMTNGKMSLASRAGRPDEFAEKIAQNAAQS
jgi:hypothetical protein